MITPPLNFQPTTVEIHTRGGGSAEELETEISLVIPTDSFAVLTDDDVNALADVLADRLHAIYPNGVVKHYLYWTGGSLQGDEATDYEPEPEA